MSSNSEMEHMTEPGLREAIAAFDDKARAAIPEEDWLMSDADAKAGMAGINEQSLRLLCAGMNIDPDEILEFSEAHGKLQAMMMVTGGPRSIGPILAGTFFQCILIGRIWGDLVTAANRKEETGA